LCVVIALLALNALVASAVIVRCDKGLAATKPIIIWSRAYLPQGEVTAHGRIVTLHPIGPENEAEPSERIHYVITVVQAATGAHGTGQPTLTRGQAQQEPLPEIRIHADGDSPPFQPGKVIVTSDATRWVKNKVVEKWIWTQGVDLVAP
jgi:hypothetical protein